VRKVMGARLAQGGGGKPELVPLVGISLPFHEGRKDETPELEKKKETL